MTTATSSMGRLSDEALLGLVATGDVAAFGVFYDRHSSAAFALSYRMVASRQRADDVCQEAFLSIWRAAGRFDGRLGTARGWLLTVVRNRSIDHLRRSGRTAAHEIGDERCGERDPAPVAEGTERRALQNAEAAETRALLRVLDPDQLRVVELAFFGGHSHVEIAAALGLPLGTVKARINRGLTRMRTAAAGATVAP